MNIILSMLAGAAPESAAVFANAEYAVLFLGAGLLMGLYHALEPDHITAVSAMITGKRHNSAKRVKKTGSVIRRGTVYGMIWGLGHTSAIFLITVAVFVFAIHIPQYVFGAFEISVGVMLMALGASALAGDKIPILSRLRLHEHAHIHEHKDGTVHSHPHSHGRSTGTNETHHAGGHRPYLIGCMHGLAGGGGLVVLWASTAMAETTAAATAATAAGTVHAPLLFASVFGAGSIIGMGAVAGLLALLFALCSSTGKIKRIIQCASGTGAVVFGAYVITVGVATMQSVQA